MSSPSTALLRSLVALIALGLPAISSALTIKSATVTVHPVKGDSFAIKGELGPLDPPTSTSAPRRRSCSISTASSPASVPPI